MADIICIVCGQSRDEDYATYRGDNAFCSKECASSYYQSQSIEESIGVFTSALEGFSETLNGFTGKSAYQSWLDNGGVGTEEEFILAIKGEKGDDGTQGLQGLQGLQGIQGERGEQGLQGIQGITGQAGSNGTDGEDGALGSQGLQGIQGIQGERGEQGLQGIQGVTGQNGTDGAKGDKGDQGNQGIQGVKGDTGSQGSQGVAGYTPVKGVDYFDGAQGIQGIQGVKGDTGSQGAQGNAGYTPVKGVDYFDGAKGDKGDTGNQGIQGIQGNQGIQGEQGIPGSGTGYAINVQALTSSPTDSQTVYFGMLPKAPTTTANTSKVYIPKSGTIKHAEIYCYSGTAGTNESWSLYIRLNNTTDTLIQTLSVNTNERRFTNNALNIAVVAGNYIEIKGVQPLWATNPLTCIYAGFIYIE